MLGFEMKFKDKILYLPLEAGFIITRRSINQEEDMYIDVGLYDPQSDNSLTWIKEELHLDDLIEIVVKQIDQTSEPLKEFNFYENLGTTKEESDKKTLERFLILKKELEVEGLI